MLNKKFISALICPNCQLPLNRDVEELICKECNRFYKIDDDIIDFLSGSLEEVKLLNSEYLDKEAKFYDRIHLHMVKENNLFQEIIKKIDSLDKIILDIATGTGFVLDNFEALNKGGKFICLDISRNMLKEALKKHKSRIAIALRADAENIPIKDNSIDVVTILSSLHHFPNPQKTLKEIHRVLIPNGILLIFHEPALRATHSFLYLAFRKIYRDLKVKNKKDVEHEKKIKEYAREIFGINEEEALKKMQEFNKITNIKEGFNPFEILSPEIYEMIEIGTYYPEKTMFSKLMTTLFPNEGELFYIIARKNET